ncbi:hypothetical protein N7491_004947 [Penicillium cf. griseofulvum]|uniref:C2H2-type domain-containing protein n=1 Tax=Penicillium cf. griseofulvum TaxID=2972120 RepID=A0A9W9J2H3_9EURO|nr:hypothetical protein N7472_007641 [Penicillium cf. griseofulvum]KAJ5434352.1 hypothetical protein N7491_004947 [Penicillium cf. griseofulvum]KAJ5452183.1 hypothetical protein N7445_000366 [Penicillium cf. griseofulvum]
MSLNSNSLYHFELSQDQSNGDSWPDLWPDELVAWDDVNPADLPLHLDPDIDLFWPQINESGLYPVASSFGPPTLSPSNSLAPPSAKPQPSALSNIYEISYQDANGDWRCNYSGCLSNQVFLRACDLRKHYRSHQKSFFCNKPDCEWSKIGFSLNKDCQRHMRSHRPMIKCLAAESLGCERVFSRIDNMKEHHRKIHEVSQDNLLPRSSRRSTGKKDDFSKLPGLDAA